jgi:hypothetical protein
MTGPEVTAPEPVAEPYAVVEAFLDGEAVDPHRLRHALDEPAVRDHLVDLLVLREGVRAITPGSWSTARTATGGRLRWIAATAAVLVALSAGYYTGQRTVVASEPRGGETIVAVESAPAPPRPTQVIRLERGVNWTDGPAGK